MIIGITGTNGSGKGTVVDYLVQRGFDHYSARDFIVEEIQRRGLTVDRSAMRDVANDLRKTHSPSYVIESLYERARQAGKDAVIESIRTIGEADYLKSHGALLLAVDADRQVRYERIVLRGSATDRVSFEQFCEQEDREMNAQDAWDMNVSGVMLRADSHVVNSGTRDELHAQIDGALEQIRK